MYAMPAESGIGGFRFARFEVRTSVAFSFTGAAIAAARDTSSTWPRTASEPESARKRLVSAGSSVLSALGANTIEPGSRTLALRSQARRTRPPLSIP
jgi:hypothetical protein